MKKCTKCNLDKELEEFSLHPGSKDGRNTQCKICRNSYHRGNYDPEKRFNWSLKRNYNINKEEYYAIKHRQNNKCAICFSETKLFVDHCHKTSKIRGLLCSQCNTGIGLLKENISNFENAIKYLS